SNIGIAKVAARLGPKSLYQYLTAFGFGERSGVELPGELSGLLRPVRQWNEKFSMTSIPMGQEVSVTPLQLATAFSAIVNGGILVRPRLARSLSTPAGRVMKTFPVEPRCRVIRKETSDTMREILAGVVTRGTGKQAACKEYAVGGKTGTAQIAGPGGYEEDRYVSSFCGFAPVEAPRLVVLVTVTEPQGVHYGGTVSAPAVGAILREALLHLGVPPRVAADLELASAEDR
ncbi:MAG: penicillin-binding transpeptidase domain-containing protein, partial [Planctomycetota bacterium]